MRNPMRGLLLAVAVLPGTIEAQRATTNARVQALEAAADSALKRLAMYDDSVRAMNNRLDSVQVGPLRMLVEPSIATLASNAAQIALNALSPRLGGELQRIGRYTYVLRVERFARWQANKPDSNIIVETFGRTGPALMNIRVRHDLGVLANAIGLYIPFYVFRDASVSFVGWMGGNVGIDTLSAEEWRLMRFALVSSPASVGRRCYAGDLRACSQTLQLLPVGDPIREWYEPSDLRRIVKRAELTALRVDGVGTRRCLDGDDLACATVLRGFPPNMLPEPAPLQSRAALARVALEMGGEGAVERMLEGDRQPLERLAHAARAPVDSILRVWQRAAQDVRASSRDLSAEIVFGALFWSFALGALSLRSSRWR